MPKVPLILISEKTVAECLSQDVAFLWILGHKLLYLSSVKLFIRRERGLTLTKHRPYAGDSVRNPLFQSHLMLTATWVKNCRAGKRWSFSFFF